MGKHDWVFVGIRLFGVFLFVEMILEAPKYLGVFFVIDWGLGTLIAVVVRLLVAWALAFKTSSVCGLLGAPPEAQEA